MTTYPTREWTFPEDRDHLPDEGPWTAEPDKVQWVDEKTGLDCLIVRASLGHLCGYVGVPPGHPLHGVSIMDPKVRYAPAHGGLTFAAPCNDDNPDGVCHVPYDDRPGDVWWLGFDCGHQNIDRSPVGEKALADLGYPELNDFFPNAVYRTVDYVKASVTELASWIAEQ